MITGKAWNGSWMILVRKGDCRPVVAGDLFHTMRGRHRVDGGRPPQHEASSGKVWTDQGEFYPSVIECKWVDVKEANNV